MVDADVGSPYDLLCPVKDCLFRADREILVIRHILRMHRNELNLEVRVPREENQLVGTRVLANRGVSWAPEKSWEEGVIAAFVFIPAEVGYNGFYEGLVIFTDGKIKQVPLSWMKVHPGSLGRYGWSSPASVGKEE